MAKITSEKMKGIVQGQELPVFRRVGFTLKGCAETPQQQGLALTEQDHCPPWVIMSLP